MDSLPQELINKIALQLERCPEEPQVPLLLQECTKDSKLPPFATISSHWKEAIEYITFQSLRVKSDELSEFQSILTGNRRRYLTKLKYEVLLPEYSEEAYGRIESVEEQELNNGAFTKGISDLFSLLRSWEEQGLKSTLQLELPYRNTYSRTDLRIQNLQDIRPKPGKDIFELRYANSILQLSNPVNLPTLSNVHLVNIRSNLVRKLASSVGPGLASSLPNLKALYWQFEERNDQAGMVEDRVKFAEALSQTQLRQLTKAAFDFYHETPSHHGVAAHRRILADSLSDPLSKCLRTFSHNLTSLSCCGHFDSALFWPSRDETCSAPEWPNLKTLEIKFNMVTPSGEWYFTGTPPEEGVDDDYCQYRDQGDVATLNPFLAAFAKAVGRMRVLEHFMLECELGDEAGFWEISYYAPGRAAENGDENGDDLQVRRVYYTVGEVWRPDDMIAEGLRNAGRQKYGEAFIERFLEPRDWRY